MGVDYFLKIRVQRKVYCKEYVTKVLQIRPLNIPNIRIMYRTGGVSNFRNRKNRNAAFFIPTVTQ